MKIPIKDLFWKRVQIPERDDGCWNWLGKGNSNGYGRMGHNGLIYAHRFSYELLKGRIQEGFTIDHLCRNRRCVNPEHLEAVTLRENVLRGTSPSAQQSRRSRCLRGHLLAGNNLFPENGHGRQCRKCDKIRKQLRRGT